MNIALLKFIAGPVFVFKPPRWLEIVGFIFVCVFWVAIIFMTILFLRKSVHVGLNSRQAVKLSGGTVKNSPDVIKLRNMRNLTFKLIFVPMGAFLFGLQRVLTMEKEYDTYQMLAIFSLLLSIGMLIVWVILFSAEKNKIANKLK